MGSDVANILLLAITGSLVALLGGVLFLYIPSWSRVLSRYSVPFAAGVLITVSLVGLLPEAVHGLGETAYVIVLLSFIISYLIEHFAFDLHHHESHKHHHTDNGPLYLVIIGDTIHNFIDGVAIAAAYLINPGLGVITTISTFLHEVPHEIGDFGILMKAGWEKAKILWVNVLSASFTIVGALLVLYLVPNEQVIGVLLAIAAGMFLYLGSSDFLPHASEGLSKNKAMTSLLLGVVIMLAVFALVPHTHEPEAGHDDHDHDEHAEDHDMETVMEHHPELFGPQQEDAIILNDDDHDHDDEAEYIDEEPAEEQLQGYL